MSKRLLALAAAGALLAACGDSTEPRVPSAIQVDQATVQMEVGETVTVTATVVDQDGRPFETPPEGHTITWTSSQEAVVIVQNGDITGVGAGNAIVSVSAGALPPTEIQVTVDPAILNITNGVFNAPFVTEDDVFPPNGHPRPDHEVTGQISFDFSGHRSGSFNVTETFRLGDIGAVDYVVTFHATDSEGEFTDLIAEREQADGRVDFIWFWVEGHIDSPGTRPAGVAFFYGWDLGTDELEAYYEFTVAGTVNHTSVTAERMQGTFDFELELVAFQTGGLAAMAPGQAGSRVVPRDLRELRNRIRR